MARTGVVMSDETKEEIAMAECGACRAIVPLKSDNCPECSISFSGVSDESLGECGACNGLVPLDSTKCSHCGTIFVADDVVEVLRKWLAETGISIPILFKKFDKDGDGQIDSSELKSGLLSLNLADLPPSQVERLIKTIDEDGDGQIDLGELHETITGQPYTPEVSSTTPNDSVESDDKVEEDESESPELEVKEESDEDSDEEESDEEESDEEESDEEESDDDEESDEDEEESDEDEEESDDDEEDDDFTRFGKAIVASGFTIREVFERLDTNEDGRLDGPELQSGLAEILGEDLIPKDVFSILQGIDKDGDGNIDAMEIIEALENLDIGIVSDKADDEYEPLSILHMISDAMDESGDSPNKFFNALDKDGDGNVSVEEFTSAIEELIESEVSAKDIESFLVNADDDGDGAIDIIEFVNALESLEDADDVLDDDSRLSPKSDKPFPTELQRKMMGKKWNDVVWPLIHLAFGLFVAIWLINGMGGIGPLSIDGSGGNVALETTSGIGHENWKVGDIYPCDAAVQVGECKNSLTPLAGDASSMPAGFYWDGILMMLLGGIGLVASLATHLAVVPGWRARAKAMKEVEDDTDEARSDDSDEEDDEDSEEDEESDDTDEEELEEDLEDEDEETGAEDDAIDIGSHIGLTLEDEEVFGEIIEFDDDDKTVTIKEDGTGEEITGYQDDMFVE